MVDKDLINIENIKNKIFIFRDMQVMIDRDLAILYNIQTKRLNEQVKRNIERFPVEFMFQLNEDEKNELVANCDRFESLKHSSSMPYVFTEQGVAMLSSVLNSDVAIQVNIQIIKSFIELRRFVSNNSLIFNRLDKLEKEQIKNNINFDKVFDLLENKSVEKNQGVFFNGEFFDTHVFILNLIQKAQSEIILIDNYVDYKTLNLFKQKSKNVNLKIYTKNITKELKIDVKKFEKQYGNIELIEFNKSHDRFLIIDKEVYHIGVSLKDIGKKWFAFSKLEEFYGKIIEGIEK